jgi:glycosyltransferase involved in cell wall biosynthesis
MSDKKIKVLFIGDHPLVPSGVGTQSKYLIEGLLATKKFSFRCLGGAIKHPNYDTQKVLPDLYGDDWLIWPVNGFGDKNVIRSMLINEKPDVIFMIQDPRFYGWLWEMEDEIHQVCPIVYWHVWDNDPTPTYNRVLYDSTDFISTLSLKTFGLLQDLKFDPKRFNYIPHAVDGKIFKPLPDEEVQKFKRDSFGPHADKKFIVFWNNRNARRKMTGDVIAAFSMFADKVGRENVSLMMHTSVHDQEGQDIIAVARCYDIEKELLVSEQRLPPETLNQFYNATDCTINISNNEGFGLSTLECLVSGNPIIVHMTGGLQFQIGDWWDGTTDFSDQKKMTIRAKKMATKAGRWFGSPVFPSTRSCTGSQPIPFIYDDRPSHEDIVRSMIHLYEMGRPARRALGLEAREWAQKTFNMESMISSFDQTISSVVQNFKKRQAFHTAVL